MATRVTENPPLSLPPVDTRSFMDRWYLPGGILLLICASFLVYLPSLSGKLIWDDEILTNNDLIQAPDGLSRFWFTTQAPDYWPLTNSSFWIEWRLWGRNPLGYHLVNLALHIGAALLVWAILRKLEIPGAFLAALLFAVHPINVESVAWISQRKNTLAMVFFLLSLLWFLRADERREISAERQAARRKNKRLAQEPASAGLGRWYWLSLLAFVLAMLSKGSVAVLPLVLLLIVWWQRRRITTTDVLWTVPFFVVAVALVAVNIWFQTHGSTEPIRTVNFAQRLAGAGAVVWFYLAKALVPIHLLFIYPQWQIDGGNILWWLPLLVAGGVTAVLLFAAARRRQRGISRESWASPLLFAWIFFGLALAPVMGFTDVGFMQYALVADHYEYIALLAVTSLIAAGIAYAWSRAQRPARAAVAIFAVAVVGACALLTWNQSRLYGDAIRLYEVTLEQNPNCWLAHNNLGVKLAESDQLDKAIEHFNQVLRLKPDSTSKQLLAQAHYNLGNILTKQGNPEDAIAHYQQALELKPEYPEVYNNWGIALAKSGHENEAIEQYSRSLRMKPLYAEALSNLGTALADTGQTQKAIEQFELAVQLEPDNGDLRYNLAKSLTAAGRSQEASIQLRVANRLKPDPSVLSFREANRLTQSGKIQEAIEKYQEALTENPDFAEAHNNLAGLLAKSGRIPEAIGHYQAALRLRPGDAETQKNLGLVLAANGRAPEAADQFREALRENPADAPTLLNLGKALLSAGQNSEALEVLQRSVKLDPNNAETHHNLGVALAKLGRVEEAVAEFEQVLRLAPNSVATYANLTTAYSQLKRPVDAIATAEKALTLARASGQTQLAQQVESWLKNYRTEQSSSSEPASRGQNNSGS